MGKIGKCPEALGKLVAASESAADREPAAAAAAASPVQAASVSASLGTALVALANRLKDAQKKGALDMPNLQCAAHSRLATQRGAARRARLPDT